MDKLTLSKRRVEVAKNAARCVFFSEMNKKKLTIQQSKFVEAMANPNTKNQTQAAIAAGCPPNSARVQASKWLTKANISEAIECRKQRALAHCRVTPEEVLGSAAFQMRSSMDDVLDDKGSFSMKKARATGAVDLLKKHRETERTIYDKDGKPIATTKTVEVELLTNQDGRKEVANYIGLEKFAPKDNAADPFALFEFLVKRLTERIRDGELEPLEERQIKQLAARTVRREFPEIDERELLGDIKPRI